MERQQVVERAGEHDGSSEIYRDDDGLPVFVLRRGTKHGGDNDGAEPRRNS